MKPPVTRFSVRFHGQPFGALLGEMAMIGPALDWAGPFPYSESASKRNMTNVDNRERRAGILSGEHYPCS